MKNITLVLLLSVFVFSRKSNQEQNKQEESSGQRPSSTQLISDLDSNEDRKLSKGEVEGQLADDFSNIDTDKDGFLAESELDKAPKPQRGEGNGPPQQASTNKDLSSEINTSVKVIPVNTDYFIVQNIIQGIQEQTVELNGVETLCYVIKTNSRATEHKMGRWCPSHIEDGMEKAGIWFKDGKAYDVSGHFIASLDEFYNDAQWKLYREDGTIKVTDTEEGCLAAAKPNVEEEYHNHCVECLPDFFKGQVTTFVIPATPQYLNRVSSERKYETKSYFLDFQYACIRILRQFNGVFIKCSVF